ncbi:proteoglycan 4-like [Pectinophora gossypiella]|uniref:proteoglycan 4-like n=1 Tax=Pectinophora gossypiella TaxID=13191 RepID=UPI00214F5A5A|nr:proteoglycan 4-like [Pectinophora gossypiella]
MHPLWIVLALLPILGGAERFNCRGRILGAYYADAKSGCKAFHVCVRVAGGGIRDFRFFCPPGTLFHQEAQTCTDWGDDDPLACPADLYDGYDTKKLSSQGTRDEETEFGLQRAETGDRRNQNNANNVNNAPASDLRAAHSSDFFSGQRDRGRDDPAPAPQRPAPQSPPRQSFRRATTPRPSPTTTQFTTAQPLPANPPHYDAGSKRKLVRKRPIYVSTQAPSTFAQSTAQSFPTKSQNYPKQAFSQPPQQSFPQQPQQPFSQPQPPFISKPQNTFQPPQQNFNQRAPVQVKQTTTTLSPPSDIPPEYKDEYVEVVRVAPKQPKNRFFPTAASTRAPAPFSPSSPAQNYNNNNSNNKKDSLVELYNYDSQSTPGLSQNDNRPFKVRNSFTVQDTPREDFARTNINSNNARNTPTTTVEYNTANSRGFATSTPAYRNFNSVSYEPEKNFVSHSGAKQNYYNGPSSTPTTTAYTTPANLNTIAYNTNIALNTIQPANYEYGNGEEDDGQYRPPQGEDDGQYRPELYERELLSGAHSLNIAASGNRLPEDQKAHGKSQVQQNKKVSQTSAPRPFRPAPTPSEAPTTTRAPEPTYTTTYRAPTVNTQRTFDYFQTYTTTSRPNEPSAPAQFNPAPVSNAGARPSTTQVPPAPRAPEPRPTPRAPAPPTLAPPRPSPRPQHSNPPRKQEDSSYDYAYYDSDTGFSEYDQIEEFGRTKSRA